jgi:hypothetical protein
MGAMMKAAELAKSCQQTRAAALDALGWAANPRNERKLSQDRSKIERVLRRNAAEAERLENTLAQSGCVAVFGPSQAGKSYLISVLARPEGEEALIAKFAGAVPEVDFIKDINPLGGEEATGLVTRFTLKGKATPEGFPVCLRLLTQCDILKILVNSYLQDGDQDYEAELEAAELDAHIRGFEARAAPAPVDVLRSEDIWDLQEYVTKNASGAVSARSVESGWARLARIAPLLGVEERGALLSILWGRHKTYTDLFVMLAKALASLRFATEAFCPMASLLPATEGILNVKTLEALLSGGDGALRICNAQGAPVEMPRAVVAALAAELRIVCRDEPHGFFRHTDLLDFPGYRSRTRQNLGKYMRDAASSAPKELFLRGKVDYLFQSYTANLELTSLILCLPDSNLEVTSLPKAIEHWIGVTHGATPEKRVGKPTLLFFALTKFDRHLMESAGEEGNDPALRFEIRLSASLLNPFAKVEPSWPRQWTPGQAFDNLFWIRNPNFKAEHVINYVERREVEIIPRRLDRLGQLRSAFIGSTAVRTHFRDPPRAWDEVMKLNDGGVAYLADALSSVATEDLKLGQIASRLAEIRRETHDLLHIYYVDDDYAVRRAQRLATVDEQIFVDLNYCAETAAFGTALRGLMMDASDFYGAFWQLLNQPAPAEARTPQPRAKGLFTSIVKPQEAVVGASDRWSRIGVAALSYWTNLMFERADDPAFTRRVGIRSETLKEIVAEFGNAARRVKLDERIAEQMRERATPNENLDAVVRKVGLVTERVINRFVAEMDFDRFPPAAQLEEFGEDLLAPVFTARPVRYNTADLPPDRRDFAADYMIGWGTAFRATVAKNAASLNGAVEDPAQNARLGEILKAIAA